MPLTPSSFHIVIECPTKYGNIQIFSTLTVLTIFFSAEKVPEPEIDEEDPLIKALKKSKEKSERKSPPDITCTDLITG